MLANILYSISKLIYNNYIIYYIINYILYNKDITAVFNFLFQCYNCYDVFSRIVY